MNINQLYVDIPSNIYQLNLTSLNKPNLSYNISNSTLLQISPKYNPYNSPFNSMNDTLYNNNKEDDDTLLYMDFEEIAVAALELPLRTYEEELECVVIAAQAIMKDHNLVFNDFTLAKPVLLSNEAMMDNMNKNIGLTKSSSTDQLHFLMNTLSIFSPTVSPVPFDNKFDRTASPSFHDELFKTLRQINQSPETINIKMKQFFTAATSELEIGFLSPCINLGASAQRHPDIQFSNQAVRDSKSPAMQAKIHARAGSACSGFGSDCPSPIAMVPFIPPPPSNVTTLFPPEWENKMWEKHTEFQTKCDGFFNDLKILMSVKGSMEEEMKSWILNRFTDTVASARVGKLKRNSATIISLLELEMGTSPKKSKYYNNEVTESSLRALTEMVSSEMSQPKKVVRAAVTKSNINKKAAASSYKRESNSRPNHSSESRKVLKTWLLDHVSYPYPDEEAKNQLAEASGLEFAQVSNWFVNARMRMLDKHNPVPFKKSSFTAVNEKYSDELQSLRRELSRKNKK